MNITGKTECRWPKEYEWPKLLEMERLYFPRPWPQNEWHSLNHGTHYLYLMTSSEDLIAFGLFSYVYGDDSSHLLKICLHPTFHGSGLALNFWDQILLDLNGKGATKVFLEVEESNKRAQKFYKKVGFLPLRLIKNYYTGGEAAQTMLLMQ
jgi:ribosomal-protein-alanine N-acetyltransferase